MGQLKISPLYLLPLALFAVSCSASRSLAEGEYRLVKNEIEVLGGLSNSDITPYIRQQPNSYLVFDFNPFQPPVVYSSSLTESSKENISNHLANLGYYSPTITASESYRRRKVSVTYSIDPGPRIPITDLKYTLPAGTSFENDFLADTLSSTVHMNDYLAESVLEKEVTRALSSMRDKGYYSLTKSNFHFEADTLSNPGCASLNYIIESERPLVKYHFRNITISHSESLPFRDNVLRRFNVIRKGDQYSERRVTRTYNNLSQLRVFNSINIETSPSESDSVDCRITLGHSEVQGIKANLESSFTSTGLIGLSPQLSYYHKNIFHGGEWLNLGFSGDFQTKPGTDTKSTEFTVSAGLSFPNPLLRTEFNTAFSYQNRPEFTRNIYSASFGVSGRIKRHTSYQFFPVQINAVYLKNLSDSFGEMIGRNPLLLHSYSNHFDGGLGGTIYYSTSTDIVPKTSYTGCRLSFDTSGNLIGLFKPLLPVNEYGQSTIFRLPFSQYVKAELNIVRTIRLGIEDENALALRFCAGAAKAYGNSFYVPEEKQFYVGGASSMRGWQARSVGPGDTPYIEGFSIPSQTGDIKLEVDAEFRFPLVWKLEGAMFVEAGNVWDSEEIDRNFLKQIAADWGFGLRLNLDFIVLRLDLGVQTYDPSGETEMDKWIGPNQWFMNDDGFALHFGVGYPF